MLVNNGQYDQIVRILQGFVYEAAPDFFTSERGWLGCFEEKLFFFPVGKSEDTITVLDPKTLKIETTFELEGKENANMYGSYL